MKTLIPTLLAFLILSGHSKALTWEWTFDTDSAATAIGDGTLTWSTEAAHTQAAFAVTNGNTVPHIGGSPAGYVHFPAYEDQADYVQLTFNGSAPNGGGVYLNQYTIIMDVYIPGTYSWLAFFNTNNTNTNDADFYVSPSGALGIGDIGYTPDATISTDAWHRIVFAADLSAGTVTYYLDGAQVFAGPALLDQRFSLYTAVDDGIDLILANEGDTSGIYTHEWLLSAFALTDHTLTADEATQLGGPKAPGIYVTGTAPSPPKLSATLATGTVPNVITLNWDQQGFLLQRSTDLATWSPVPGSTTVKTWSEPVSGSRASFRLANP